MSICSSAALGWRQGGKKRNTFPPLSPITYALLNNSIILVLQE